MRTAFATGLILTLVAAVLSATAAAAPVSTKAPSISGTPAYASTLTCEKGSWSPDAVSFDYAWTYSGGGPQIASGQKLHVAKTLVGYNVVCQVTAHDAQGATTAAVSPAVLITPGIPTVKITKVKPGHGSIEISGIAGPAAARTRSSTSKPTMVLDRMISEKLVTQIAGPLILKPNGHFTIGGKDTPGRHTYIVIFVPAPVSGYTFTRVERPNLKIPH
jgi:hypothetical protein